MANGRTLGIIGGSGLYQMEGLSGVEEHSVSTPFGDPSDVIVSGYLGSTKLCFLPRHGRGHPIPPNKVNYRANVLALKQLGVEQILSVSAVGSMREDIAPGDFVLVDQFIDRTTQRARSYFDEVGAVAHIPFADPIDAALSEAAAAAAEKAGVKFHKGGTYICIEGPQFSTRAESKLFRSWGADVIGMTNLPEARLAREAQLPYATLALATDYDCWHESEEDVSVEAVIALISQGMGKATAVVAALAQSLPDPSKSPARTALKQALITQEDRVPAALREKLKTLFV